MRHLLKIAYHVCYTCYLLRIALTIEMGKQSPMTTKRGLLSSQDNMYVLSTEDSTYMLSTEDSIYHGKTSTATNRTQCYPYNLCYLLKIACLLPTEDSHTFAEKVQILYPKI